MTLEDKIRTNSCATYSEHKIINFAHRVLKIIEILHYKPSNDNLRPSLWFIMNYARARAHTHTHTNT